MHVGCRAVLLTGLCLAVLGVCPVVLPKLSTLVGTKSFAPHRWLRQSSFLAGTIFNPATTVDASADVASQPVYAGVQLPSLKGRRVLCVATSNFASVEADHHWRFQQLCSIFAASGAQVQELWLAESENPATEDSGGEVLRRSLVHPGEVDMVIVRSSSVDGSFSWVQTQVELFGTTFTDKLVWWVPGFTAPSQEPDTEDSAALVPLELLLLAARVVATQEEALHALDAAMSQTAADTGFDHPWSLHLIDTPSGSKFLKSWLPCSNAEVSFEERGPNPQQRRSLRQQASDLRDVADSDQKAQQSWVFRATCKLTQQRSAITQEELQEWDILFGDLFAFLEREGLLGDQQQAVTDAQSHALPRDIASLTQAAQSWQWEPIGNAPAGIAVGASVTAGGKWMVLGGFKDWHPRVLNDQLHMFDFEEQKWTRSVKIPDDVGLTHFGVATDEERFVYLVGGQRTAECGPTTRTSYRFDVHAERWERIPDLPELRYNGAMGILNGRLHYVGGADQTRGSVSTAHWSINVTPPEAILSSEWVPEADVPVAHSHASGIVIHDPVTQEDALYVFGGTKRDLAMEDEGNGHTHCGKSIEVADHHVFSFQHGVWLRRADLPFGYTHMERCTMPFANRTMVLSAGGQHHYGWPVNTIRAYDVGYDVEHVVGWVPNPKLTTPGMSCAVQDNTMYATSQEGLTWKAELPPYLYVHREQQAEQSMADSHDE
ncbi:hypothetical protein WJX84_007212 [Apatococcus fuscideae]|uniref:Uncharacterized protein n=1 Tax=Apatococcus fuscideae TaxID=2026836 RepID=A0AAW1TAR1_9CHLO